MRLPPSSYLAFGATSLGKHRPLSGVCNSITSQTAVSEIKFWSYNLHTHQTATYIQNQVSYDIFVWIDLHLNSSLVALIRIVDTRAVSSIIASISLQKTSMTVFGRNIARSFDKDGQYLCRNTARTVPSIFGRR